MPLEAWRASSASGRIRSPRVNRSPGAVSLGANGHRRGRLRQGVGLEIGLLLLVELEPCFARWSFPRRSERRALALVCHFTADSKSPASA